MRRYIVITFLLLIVLGFIFFVPIIEKGKVSSCGDGYYYEGPETYEYCSREWVTLYNSFINNLLK